MKLSGLKLTDRDIEAIVEGRLDEELQDAIHGIREQVTEGLKDEKAHRYQELVAEATKELLEEQEEEIAQLASEEVDLEFQAEFNRLVGITIQEFKQDRYEEVKAAVLAEMQAV